MNLPITAPSLRKRSKLSSKEVRISRSYGLFNRNEPSLKFIQQFKDNEQVKIYRRKDGSRPPDRHYKIIDGGKKAYLSEHDLGDHERTYKEISCSGFSEDIVARIDALLFQDLRQDLNKFELVGVLSFVGYVADDPP